MYNRIAIILAATTIAVLFAASSAIAQSVDTSSFEGESMTETVSPANQDVINDANASGGQTRRFTDPATASKTVTPTKAIDTLSLRFRNTYDGGRPTVKVLVDGVQAITSNTGANSYTTATASVNLAANTSHTIAVTAANMSGSRKVFADKVDLTGPDAPPPPPSCTGGVPVTPSQNLAAVAAAHSGATTYCLADGTYTLPGTDEVAVESGDEFIGQYSDGSRVLVKSDGTYSWSEADGARVVDSTPQANILDLAGASDTVVQGIRVSGASHDNACEPDCGRGAAHGNGNNVFSDFEASYNENAGIGSCGAGTIVKNGSLLTRNGNTDSARDGGPVSAAGIKCGAGFSVLSGSSASDNYWNGVWCDTDCEWLVVEDSTTSDNGKAGIDYEIADGTQQSSFARNTIKNNGRLPGANRRAGILVNSSRNLDVSFNTFGGNTVAGESPASYGVQLLDDSRPPVTGDIQVHDNTMLGDQLFGCDLPDNVSCTNNTP